MAGATEKSPSAWPAHLRSSLWNPCQHLISLAGLLPSLHPQLLPSSSWGGRTAGSGASSPPSLTAGRMSTHPGDCLPETERKPRSGRRLYHQSRLGGPAGPSVAAPGHHAAWHRLPAHCTLRSKPFQRLRSSQSASFNSQSPGPTLCPGSAHQAPPGQRRSPDTWGLKLTPAEHKYSEISRAGRHVGRCQCRHRGKAPSGSGRGHACLLGDLGWRT